MDFTKEVQDWLRKALEPLNLKWTLKQPWDALKHVQKLEVEKEQLLGQIEAGVKWDVPIVLGKNSVIKFPTRIEGPVLIGENTIIGPHAYIRGPCIIGNDCKIGSTEVKASVIMDGVSLSHQNYVGDSIIGKRVNVGAGAKFANLRFDEEIIKVTSGEKLVSTGLRKLGAIIEPGAAIGCNAVLNPGTYVNKNAKVMPGAVVSGFVK